MDSVAHTLTDKATMKFDTGNIAGNGGTGTFTAPTTPGSYPFGCTYHPNMAGTLVVTAGAAGGSGAEGLPLGACIVVPPPVAIPSRV